MAARPTLERAERHDYGKATSVAARPDQPVDEIALIGPKERIKQRLAECQESAPTGLLVRPKTDADLATFAELILA